MVDNHRHDPLLANTTVEPAEKAPDSQQDEIIATASGAIVIHPDGSKDIAGMNGWTHFAPDGSSASPPVANPKTATTARGFNPFIKPAEAATNSATAVVPPNRQETHDHNNAGTPTAAAPKNHPANPAPHHAATPATPKDLTKPYLEDGGGAKMMLHNLDNGTHQGDWIIPGGNDQYLRVSSNNNGTYNFGIVNGLEKSGGAINGPSVRGIPRDQAIHELNMFMKDPDIAAFASTMPTMNTIAHGFTQQQMPGKTEVPLAGEFAGGRYVPSPPPSTRHGQASAQFEPNLDQRAAPVAAAATAPQLPAAGFRPSYRQPDMVPVVAVVEPVYVETLAPPAVEVFGGGHHHHGHHGGNGGFKPASPHRLGR